MKRTIAVVTAGLGNPSSSRLLADRLAVAGERELRYLGDEADVRVIEVREHGHGLVDALLRYPGPTLEEALDTVAGADGLIAVTPAFEASYSGLFKMFFEVLDVWIDDALTDKPVLIGATGGTARHSLMLENAVRPLFGYLRAVVVPTAVFAAPEDWAGAAAPLPMGGRIGRAASQFAWEIRHRRTTARPDPLAPAHFEDLLGAGPK